MSASDKLIAMISKLEQRLRARKAGAHGVIRGVSISIPPSG